MEQKQVRSENIEKARGLMGQVLQLLREDRDQRAVNKEVGGREVAEAITCMETGSMWMIRSLFAHEPYSPELKLKPANEQTSTGGSTGTAPAA